MLGCQKMISIVKTHHRHIPKDDKRQLTRDSVCALFSKDIQSVDEWMDRQTDRQRDRWMNEETDGQIDQLIHSSTNHCTDQVTCPSEKMLPTPPLNAGEAQALRQRVVVHIDAVGQGAEASQLSEDLKNLLQVLEWTITTVSARHDRTDTGPPARHARTDAEPTLQRILVLDCPRCHSERRQLRQAAATTDFQQLTSKSPGRRRRLDSVVPSTRSSPPVCLGPGSASPYLTATQPPSSLQRLDRMATA